MISLLTEKLQQKQEYSDDSRRDNAIHAEHLEQCDEVLTTTTAPPAFLSAT